MLLFFATVLVCGAKPPVWEEVDSASPAVVQVLEASSQEAQSPFQVVVVEGAVYIWTSRPVSVKLFSILGQLVAQKDLQPGLHRLSLSSRGIYVLRAGSITRRVAL